jgi:hypothetical protein
VGLPKLFHSTFAVVSLIAESLIAELSEGNRETLLTYPPYPKEDKKKFLPSYPLIRVRVTEKQFF